MMNKYFTSAHIPYVNLFLSLIVIDLETFAILCHLFLLIFQNFSLLLLNCTTKWKQTWKEKICTNTVDFQWGGASRKPNLGKLSNQSPTGEAEGDYSFRFRPSVTLKF